MDATEDLTTNRDLIKHCSDEQWKHFEDEIERLETEDLALIAERLGMPEQESWKDYCNAFSDYEWYQFAEAYHHVLARDYE